MDEAKTTSKKITDALCNLLKTQSFSSVKVVSIIKEAGVSHQTFYRLFKDKYDVVYSICTVDFSLYPLIYGDNATWREIVLAVLNTIRHKPDFFRRILSDPESSKILVDALFQISVNKTGYIRNTHNDASRVIWLYVLQTWSQNKFSDTAEEIYRVLICSLPAHDLLNKDELEQYTARYSNFRIGDFRHKNGLC